MKRIRALLVVALPLLVMAGWVLSLSVALARSTEVTLPIRGYDPRDPLRGHYLQYTVDYGLTRDVLASIQKNDLSDTLAEDYCVCLERDPTGAAKGTSVGPCSKRDPSACPLFIRGKLRPRWNWDVNEHDWDIVAGIERFYIPDRYHEALATIPEGAKIQVQVTSSGVPYVTEMVVGSTPVLEYIRP